jgi:integrase
MLTELTLRQATAKDGKRIEIWDEKIPGFGVRISPSGVKTFVMMYYAAGAKRRHSIGRYPVKSLVEARRDALTILKKVADGEDPRGDIAQSRNLYAFEQVVDEFVRLHCARHNRANHAQETERLLRTRFVASWAGRDIRDIGRADVLRVIDKAVEAGTPSLANHALAAIRKMLNWCIERGLLDANPCAHISRPSPLVSRERVLSDEEVGAVWLASRQLSTPFAQIVRLLMLTAQRRSEVAGMAWIEIDWSDRTWTIPSDRTKNKRVQTVPLSDLAIDILRGTPNLDRHVVFPARGNASNSPSGFSKMKRRLDQLSGVSDWTLHDLRRTVATHMARSGVAPHVIERILNHSTGILGGVAGVYNRFQYLPEMRCALDAWSCKLASLGSDTP